MNLKQFVPSSVCLKCDGCCRFQSADSPWRPKWDGTIANISRPDGRGHREFTDDQNYVTTIQDCGQHLCRFFNKGDSTCRIYHDRPFECALYPFILSKEAEANKLYVHLSCPYIQDTEGTDMFNGYVEYLKSYFHRGDVLDFLKRNAFLTHDYSAFRGELQFLFDLSI